MRIGNRELTDSEARTIRIAVGVLLVYLVIYGVTESVTILDDRARRYKDAKQELESLETEVLRRRKEVGQYVELRAGWDLDLERIASDKIVSEVRTALDKHASASGVSLVGTHERAGSATDRARVHVEVKGEVQKIFDFVERLDELGLPLYVRRCQIIGGDDGPGRLGATLTIGILDYRRWADGGSRV